MGRSILYGDRWLFEEKQKPLEDQTILALAKYIEESKGESAANEFIQSAAAEKAKRAANFTTEYFDEQVPVLAALSQYE
ncbi:MAG TPA: hypothetical protein VIM79_11105 [Niastella sp.]